MYYYYYAKQTKACKQALFVDKILGFVGLLILDLEPLELGVQF